MTSRVSLGPRRPGAVPALCQSLTRSERGPPFAVVYSPAWNLSAIEWPNCSDWLVWSDWYFACGLARETTGRPRSCRDNAMWASMEAASHTHCSVPEAGIFGIHRSLSDSARAIESYTLWVER